MDKRFSEEIFNQKRFSKLICKWILACMLFSLQRSNIPAANHFPGFSVPKCTLPHTAPADFTVSATASYTYRPDNTTFYIKKKTKPPNFLIWLPWGFPGKILLLEVVDCKNPEVTYMGVGTWLWCSIMIWGYVSNLTIQWREQKTPRINVSF